MVKLYHIMSTIAWARSISVRSWLLLASPFLLYAIVRIYFVRYYKPKSTLFRTLPPKLKELDRDALDASPRSKGAPEKIRLACAQVCRFPVGATSHTFVRALRGWAQARVGDTQGTGPASGDRAATINALDLLERVVDTARACPGHWKPKKVHSGFVMHRETLRAQVVEYTARECLWIICNALLGNIREDPAASLKPDYKRSKGLKLDALLFDPMDIINASTARQSRLDDALIATEKLMCLLNYVALSLDPTARPSKDLDNRKVRFEVLERSTRELSLTLEEGPHGQGGRLVFDADQTVVLHDGRMEHPTTLPTRLKANWGFVNFANAVFGYGEFIASCTQEEILQVMAPEMNLGLLHFGTMSPSQVIVVRNVRRFSEYEGYLHTFRYMPRDSCGEPFDVLTMDACTSLHYRTDMQLRDMNKALLCFSQSTMVSSGRWGCGIFGGYSPHKLVQQAVAASLAGSRLYFSHFRGSEDEQAELKACLRAMHGKPLARIWAALKVQDDWALPPMQQVPGSNRNSLFVQGFCKALETPTPS